MDSLIEALADEATRKQARTALLHHGRDALRALTFALGSGAHSRLARWHIPETLAGFEPQRAAAVLLSHLPQEDDGMLRYRSIRALEAIMHRNPALELDKKTLEQAVASSVGRAFRYLERRLALERGAREVPARRTPGHELLLSAIKGKEANTIERLFRLLALRYPAEDFHQIFSALHSDSSRARASGQELIAQILRPPLREAVLALVDDLNDEERLNQGRAFHTPLGFDYEEQLDQMLDSSSETLQSMTVFHIGELGLRRFHDRIAALPRTETTASDIERVLSFLEREARAC